MVIVEVSMSHSGRGTVHLARGELKAEVGDLAITPMVLHFTKVSERETDPCKDMRITSCGIDRLHEQHSFRGVNMWYSSPYGILKDMPCCASDFCMGNELFRG